MKANKTTGGRGPTTHRGQLPFNRAERERTRAMCDAKYAPKTRYLRKFRDAVTLTLSRRNMLHESESTMACGYSGGYMIFGSIVSFEYHISPRPPRNSLTTQTKVGKERQYMSCPIKTKQLEGGGSTKK